MPLLLDCLLSRFSAPLMLLARANEIQRAHTPALLHSCTMEESRAHAARMEARGLDSSATENHASSFLSGSSCSPSTSLASGQSSVSLSEIRPTHDLQVQAARASPRPCVVAPLIPDVAQGSKSDGLSSTPSGVVLPYLTVFFVCSAASFPRNAV